MKANDHDDHLLQIHLMTAFFLAMLASGYVLSFDSVHNVPHHDDQNGAIWLNESTMFHAHKMQLPHSIDFGI